MGIFEDEQRKIAEEAARRTRSDEQRKAELSQAALRVSEDLLSFIANNPEGKDIDVGFVQNQITLHGRSTGKTLEITCNGPDIFRLKGDIGTHRNKGFQTQVTEPRRSADNSGAITKSEMARMVIAWGKRAARCVRD